MTTPRDTMDANLAEDPDDLPLASSAALVDVFVQEAQAHGPTVGHDVRASLNDRILAQDKTISAERIEPTTHEHWYRTPRVMNQLVEIADKHLALRLTSTQADPATMETETLTTITVDDLANSWERRVAQQIPAKQTKPPAPGMTWIPR